MKRLLALFMALALLLCGCAKEAESAAETTTTTATSSTTTKGEEPTPDEPVLDFGCYLPDSPVELATNGAVKAYDIELDECNDMVLMEGGLLLFSGEMDTELTYLAPDGTSVSKTLENIFLLPQYTTLIPEKDAVAYFDEVEGEMVLLDTQLKEVDRVSLPENIVGMPVVDGAWETIYFFTDDSLRCLNISTGIDRMLKQMSFSLQEIQMLHFDDSLLECLIFNEDNSEIMMINTGTGELVYSTTDWPMISTWGDRYFATHYESGVSHYLFGVRGGDIQRLKISDSVFLNAPEMWAAVGCAETEGAMRLDYYDLQAGVRASSVELEGMFLPECLAADVQRNAIWFTAVDGNFEYGLYRWDVELSRTENAESVTEPYYTEDDPDVDGLSQIEERADELGREYGVRVRVYEDAIRIEPSDYQFELEHNVSVYEYYLDILEEALAAYPEGFLKKVGSTSGNGKLTISLIGGAYGDNGMGSLDSADGVHFYNDGNVYIGLVMGDLFEQTMYHEMFHAIDTYVLSNCNLFDDWDKLNPEGFAYDNDYVTNQFREDYQYLEDDQWFIDMYSMSYAKEDRARIMEYAMQEGNGIYFESPHMQAKLQLLCKGIRKAFGLQNNSSRFVWEQYLK